MEAEDVGGRRFVNRGLVPFVFVCVIAELLKLGSSTSFEAVTRLVINNVLF